MLGTYEAGLDRRTRDRCTRSPYGVHVWTRGDGTDDICRHCRRYASQVGQS